MAESRTEIRPLPAAALRVLESELRGEVVRPGDDAFDHRRRVWNTAVDRRPALIVRPHDAADVQRVIDVARTHDIPIAVRSPAGFGTIDDGIVIDLTSMARVGNDETAFAHRDKAFYLAADNSWDGGDADQHVAWTEQFWRAVARQTDGAYAGFLADEGDERVRSAYPPATYARMAEAKQRYDPDNRLRSYANVHPGQPSRRSA